MSWIRVLYCLTNLIYESDQPLSFFVWNDHALPLGLGSKEDDGFCFDSIFLGVIWAVSNPIYGVSFGVI